MDANEHLHSIFIKLFLRGQKINITVAFISQSYFKVSNTKTKCDTLFYHKNT